MLFPGARLRSQNQLNFCPRVNWIYFLTPGRFEYKKKTASKITTQVFLQTSTLPSDTDRD